jgi:hypothetical protein
VSDLEAANQAYAAAGSEVRAIEKCIADEIAQASVAVRKRHEAVLVAAQQGRSAARIALTAAQDAGPEHEWTGQRVTKLVPNWKYGRLQSTETLTGIVETVRSTTEFAGNLPLYGRPRIGDPIVRLLKKDGTPGLKFERLHGNYHGWKLEGAR